MFKSPQPLELPVETLQLTWYNLSGLRPRTGGGEAGDRP